MISKKVELFLNFGKEKRKHRWYYGSGPQLRCATICTGDRKCFSNKHVNQLLKHPVLQHTQYSLLHDPNVEGVQQFLAKRNKQMKMFKYFALGLFVLGLTMIIEGSNSFVEYFATFFMLFSIGWAHLQQKKCVISDEEIRELIKPTRTNGG